MRRPALAAPALVALLGGVVACADDAPASTAAPVDRAAAEERALALFAVAGTSPVDATLAERQATARRLDKKADAWIVLGRAWVEKARFSSDPGFYLHADAAAKTALRLEPDNVAALNLRGLVLLNDHRFADAKALAEQMLAKDPDDPMALGTLSDALLELGDVDGAARAAQRMMDKKPNLPSYARASYLKWLHGDVDGAIESVRLAIDAGRGQKDPEPTAWVLVEAAHLFRHRGDLEGADAGYDVALRAMPDYAPALVGKARVALLNGDAAQASALLEAAAKKTPSLEAYALLAQAKAAGGDAAGAQAALDAAIAQGRKDDERGLALLLAQRGERLDEAQAAIDAERAGRGGPYVDDVVAWVKHRKGDVAGAKDAIAAARRYGTPDARLRFHEGAILLAAGDAGAAKTALREALAWRGSLDLDETAEAKRLLAQVGGAQ